MKNRIKQIDVAKIVKNILKKKLPNTKFSVKTSFYSGGSSIDVFWTNGANKKTVEKLVGHFHGAEFDGMQDLKYYNERPYSNDFIHFHREISESILFREAKKLAEEFGHKTKGKNLGDLLNIWLDTRWLSDALHMELREKDL